MSINQTADWEVFSDVLGESGFFSAIKLTMVNKGRKFPYSSPKRKTLQAESKKRLILKVATEVFAEKGFNGATISQVAKKGNIAESSIYDRFK